MLGKPDGMIGRLVTGVVKRCFPRLWKARQVKNEVEAWIARGRPARPPHAVKSNAIKEYARRFRTPIMVETGTYRGDMVESCRVSFREIYSIELSKELHGAASQRFSPYRGVRLLLGDSAQVLPELLPRITEPCLFWLDAHYSGGATAQGPVLTPILQELEWILEHPIRGHVILIDDACDFVGTEGYPTIAEVREYVHAHAPEASFEVRDDIVRIHR